VGVARRAWTDRYEVRHPRHLATLDLAAEKAGWREPLPAGHARGVALHESFNSVVAQVAEVSLRPDGLPKVERVVCAVDCGTAINPDVVRAQMESRIGFGLAGALWSEITLVRGRVQQRNFDGYRPLRIEDVSPGGELRSWPRARQPEVAPCPRLHGLAEALPRRDLRAGEGPRAQWWPQPGRDRRTHVADPLVGWAWNPGADREPAAGTQAAFGALIKAWADSGAACRRDRPVPPLELPDDAREQMAKALTRKRSKIVRVARERLHVPRCGSCRATETRVEHRITARSVQTDNFPSSLAATTEDTT
jgi:hypothetical protein